MPRGSGVKDLIFSRTLGRPRRKPIVVPYGFIDFSPAVIDLCREEGGPSDFFNKVNPYFIARAIKADLETKLIREFPQRRLSIIGENSDVYLQMSFQTNEEGEAYSILVEDTQASLLGKTLVEMSFWAPKIALSKIKPKDRVFYLLNESKVCTWEELISSMSKIANQESFQ